MTYQGVTITFDDPMLAHLQIVISRKVSRGQAFLLSWVDRSSSGRRDSIWIASSVSLRFDFSSRRRVSIDRLWLLLLSASADSPLGLLVTDMEGNPVEADSDRTVA